MASIEQMVIHVDGAARGNPGPAAFAFVFLVDGQAIYEENGYLGQTTNNIAEYTALVKALEKAADFGPKEILVRSDSELMVKQMNGQYKVKNEGLKELHVQARQLAGQFPSVRYTHVFREDNKEADRLCNEALDAAAKGRSGNSAAARPAGPIPTTPAKIESVRDPAPATAVKEPTPEYVKIDMRGWLKTGIHAIGGETTGIILTANSVTLELDLTGSLSAAKKADRLNGQL